MPLSALAPPPPTALGLALLVACSAPAPDAGLADQSPPLPPSWNAGLEGFVADTGVLLPPEGPTDAFDGAWEGTVVLDLDLLDFALTCTCSQPVILEVEQGQITQVGGSSCAMDCGIGTQVFLDGVIDGEGDVVGRLTENLSFFYDVPWTGRFEETIAAGIAASEGLATGQGVVDLTATVHLTKGAAP